MSRNLPIPDTAAQALSQQLTSVIHAEITAKGPISFARYMELALYAPQLGYYTGPAHKFGSRGDFTTAPELSPLYGECLAHQIQPILQHLEVADILEFGAGSGQLALNTLTALEKSNTLPDHYYILELSAELQQRQKKLLAEKIPHLLERIIWLQQLPENLQGVVIANEVLDAMPVERFQWQNQQAKQLMVDWQNQQFVPITQPAPANLSEKIAQLNIEFSENYSSEINLALKSWIAAIANFLQRGLVLIIDYGFPRHEYYHPDRSMGTLMCHYQHHAHDNPFFWPGLQDLTTHVDFTAVAEAAIAANLSVGGYTTQANFLLGCGLLAIADNMNNDEKQQYSVAQQLKKLLLPGEMGELFKVMALTKNLSIPLIGFNLYNMTTSFASIKNY